MKEHDKTTGNICKSCGRECGWYSKVFEDCDKCTKRSVGKIRRTNERAR